MLSLKIKTFYLLRHQDVNGLSGTGIVAVGVVWPTGRADMQWVSYKRSLEQHDDGIEALMDIHGHGGATELIWGDPPCAEDLVEKPVKKPRKKKKSETEG